MEQSKQEKAPPMPVGISGNPKTNAQLNWREFHELKMSISNMLDFLIHVEQRELEQGNLKYFFEEDLVEKQAFDKEGNPVKNEKGEHVTYKDLRDDFWQEKPKSLIITPDQMKITPEVN